MKAQQILNITFGRESHIMNQCVVWVYFEFPKAILNCATATSSLPTKRYFSFANLNGSQRNNLKLSMQKG